MNDDGCGWLNIMPKRQPNSALDKDVNAKWVIVGAGFSGLSAAITLAEKQPNDEIILIDAANAGEGASARNSGYLVDTTLNDGHMSDTGIAAYKQKYDLNLEASNLVKQMVDKYSIDCDWNECGKYYASSTFDNEDKLNNFKTLLDSLNIKGEFYEHKELSQKLGTEFYKMAVKTFGGAMLQPAALARGLINALPANVSLYENTKVLKINFANQHIIKCKNATIKASNLIIAVNGYMAQLGVKKDRAFPLLLTASLTRALNPSEIKAIKQVDEWAVLSANHMGATLRYTADNRLMIRNSVQVTRDMQLGNADMKLKVAHHLKGLKARFDFLPDDIIAHSWTGITCISANNANVFDEIAPNCWAIGCYNGGGIGLGCLFGQEIAHKALGENTQIIELIEQRPKPKWLPPQPFLNWGVATKLALDRRKAVEEA